MNEQKLKQMNERNVIAGILLKPENFNEARNILRSEDFSDYIYRSIFSACEKIYLEDGKITPDKIISQLLDINNIHEIIIDIIEGTYDLSIF